MKDLEISKELLIEVLGSEYNQRLVDWFQIEDDNFLRTHTMIVGVMMIKVGLRD